MTTGISRREFLERAAGAVSVVAPILIPASALGRSGRVAPSERVVMGSIGVGNMGFADMGTQSPGWCPDGYEDVRPFPVFLQVESRIGQTEILPYQTDKGLSEGYHQSVAADETECLSF